MRNAFVGQILGENLTSGAISIENLNTQWARQTLGGAGLATRFLFELTSPSIDPLGAENVLIFMTGALTGTPYASASRYSVVAILKKKNTAPWSQNRNYEISAGSICPHTPFQKLLSSVMSYL